MNLHLDVPDALVEVIAARAAELVAEREAKPAGFLDVAAAADFLACPASRVYSLVSAKRLPVHRDGSRLLFDRAELREYVASGGATRP